MFVVYVITIKIEILFMYYWIHDMEGDNDYWQEYLDTVLPALKKE